jgi:hypothetical protein
MARYTESSVVSIRMEAELLDALRERANAEGRSVSGEIVFILRDRVRAEAPKPERRPITGWLRNVQAPRSHAEFRSGRERASRDLLRAVRRKASKR